MGKIDCGDSSCYFAEDKTGMRTNGGCCCHQKPYFHLHAREWWAENKKLQSCLDWFGIEITKDGDYKFKPSKMTKIWKYLGDKRALELEAENKSLRAENERLKDALRNLINTLEPAVNYKGLQVVWGAQDREWTREAIQSAREVLNERD